MIGHVQESFGTYPGPSARKLQRQIITSGHWKYPSSSKPSTTTSAPIAPAMFLQRTAVAAARRAAVSPAIRRGFTTTFVRRESFPPDRLPRFAFSTDLGPLGTCL